VAVLFLLHPAYGVYGLLCAAFLFVLSLITDLSTREDLVRANGETAKSMNDLSAALRNTELLDGMGMLPTVARRWSQRQQQTLDDLKRATRRSKALATTAKAARLAMQGGIIALGTILVLRYEATPGSMMGSNLLVAKLLLPFEQLVSGWRQWTSALAAWGRVRDLVGAAPPDSGHTMPDRIEAGWCWNTRASRRPARLSTSSPTCLWRSNQVKRSASSALPGPANRRSPVS
jgi:ATP-binding cassette subfamily C protein